MKAIFPPARILNLTMIPGYASAGANNGEAEIKGVVGRGDECIYDSGVLLYHPTLGTEAAGEVNPPGHRRNVCIPPSPSIVSKLKWSWGNIPEVPRTRRLEIIYPDAIGIIPAH